MTGDLLLRVYHRLPNSAQTMAATARGLYLRRWRYGPKTESLIAQAQERERWPAERWAEWRDIRLTAVLERAAATVPYYRDYWRARRAAGDHSPVDRLENWPILEKEVVRANPKQFVCDTARQGRLYPEHTSGTSGKPIDLFRSPATVRDLYALSELRERRWHGVSVQQPWAILGGQLVAPVTRRRPPFWVWNAALHQLYMSSYHLAPDLVPHYLDALARFRIQYLWGYSSALHTLAQEALRLRRPLEMRVVITNAEPLFSEQRKTIAEAFKCPVRETYGMAEFVVAASECEAGSLHQWPEVGVLEVVPDSGSASEDGSGEFVCTSLMNTAMPLIRYRTGDRGRLAPSSRECACGRTLPVVESIEGRVDDTIYTTDGRRVGRIDPVFKTRLDLREAQIIQETLQRIRVRFVAGPGFEESTGQTIVQRLRDRLGPVEVVLEPVANIPRGAHGKFRGVVCALSPHERQKVGLA